MLGIAILGLLGFLGLILVILYACADARRRADDLVQRFIERVPPQPALNLTYPPARIELVPCADMPWGDPVEIATHAERLRALSFQDAGRYRIAQIPNVYRWAFVRPETGVTVVLSETAGKPATFEMATHYRDGSSFAVCSGPQVGLVTPAPHWTVRRTTATDPASVYERMLTERPDKPIDHDQVNDFVARYQERYARWMDWRNLQGGYTADEIQTICTALGLSPTEKMVADCRQSVAQQALRGMEVILQEQFFTQAQLRDAEAEALLPMVVIHDRLDFDMLVPMFTARWLAAFQTQIPEPCPVAELARPLADKPREAFALLNELMPGPRFQLAGRIAEPVEADVYVIRDELLPSRLRPTGVSE